MCLRTSSRNGAAAPVCIRTMFMSRVQICIVLFLIFHHFWEQILCPVRAECSRSIKSNAKPALRRGRKCQTRESVGGAVQILICQNLRNNLQHPNEYIRGMTLRFLCRIREEEILEPLIPSILSCLEHRHSYVRRNAVLAINSLYKLPKGELLLVDAPELIEKVLLQPLSSPCTLLGNSCFFFFYYY